MTRDLTAPVACCVCGDVDGPFRVVEFAFTTFYYCETCVGAA